MSESLPLVPLNSSPEQNKAPKSAVPAEGNAASSQKTPVDSTIKPNVEPKKADVQEPKPSVLGSLKEILKQQNRTPAPKINTPILPQVLTPEPLSSTPTPKAPTPSIPPPPASSPVASVTKTPDSKASSTEKKEVTKGNLFTRMFKGSKVDENKGSIIDTIVDKTEAEKAKAKAIKKNEKQSKQAKKKPKDWLFWNKASRFFFHFTLLFIVVGTVFLYIQIVDVNNSVLNWFNGPQNYAIRLNDLQSQLAELEKQEAELSGEVIRFQGGYKDPNEAIVGQIVEGRLSWEEIKEQLDGAAEQLYPLNDFFGYLQYTNFNIGFQTKQVSFTGILRDPSGNNFTALADFENILKTYPNEPNQDNGLKPSFTDIQEITSYSERYDSNTDTYETVFSMSMKINDQSAGFIESVLGE